MANVPISAFTVPANTVGIGATGYSLTGSASASFMDLSGTWNTSGTPTAIKLNITGADAGSAAGSLLMDLQVGGVSRFRVRKDGSVFLAGSTSHSLSSDGSQIYFFNNGTSRSIFSVQNHIQIGISSDTSLGWAAGPQATGGVDLFLTRRGAANLRLGAADAAAPVAQTLSVQSGVTGASATTVSISGTALTIAGTVTGTIAIGHAVTGTGVSAGTLITAGSGTSWTVNNSQTVGPITAYFNSVGRDFTITGNQASGPSAGGSIVFQVAPAGAAATTAQNALVTAWLINSAGSFVPGSDNGPNLGSGASRINSAYIATAIELGANATLKWVDVTLQRDTANTLALRNGTAAQRFNVYNTWTSSTNYETFKIDWITTANTVLVGTEKGSGGGTARDLAFQTDGTTRLTFVSTSGAATFSNRVTAMSYTASEFFNWSGSSEIRSPSNGVITISSQSGGAFGRLQFGGTTSSFPALKRSSATLQARLADDSDFAPIQGKLTTETAYTAGTVVVTGYLTLYDSTGTAYRVPCLV